MKISKKVTIKKSAEEVWAVLGEDFVNASKWMSGANHSFEMKGENLTGSPACGRVCEVGASKNPIIIDENIHFFNRQQMSFAFEVTPREAGKLPIIKSITSFNVKKLSNSSCEVSCIANVTLKPFALLLLPLLKIGFGKNFGNILKDLQFYVETGTVHPRKVKALKNS
ncbi:MAG: hypothetical protein GY787_27830 [Alteromonadales bacterium]|nr:hypothetical protein [Alteromonadales bacterium]